MSKLNDLIDDYLFSNNDSNHKNDLFQRLINESPEKTLEENELENLLSAHFEPIDISSKCLKTIQNLENSTEPKEFSKKVLEDIKQRKKRAILYPAILSIAAIIAIGLYVNFNSSQKSVVAENSLKSGDSIEGESTKDFSEGLTIKSSKNTNYTYINSTSKFLRLNTGSLIVNVDKQTRKSPLIFSMPYGDVKVIGTKFNLLADNFHSEVFVSEGKVEFHKQNSYYVLIPGELGYSDDKSIRKSFIFAKNEWNYKFENERSSPVVDGKVLFKPGIIGNALEFNGLQKVRLQRKTITKNETFSFWVKITETSPIGQSIAGQHAPIYSTNGFHIYEEKGQLHLQIKNQKEEFDKVLDLDLSEWVHLVFIKNEWHINKLFVNGELVIKQYLKYDYESNSKFYLGRSEDRFWAPLHGLIDELRIYRRELTVSEIKKLYSEKDLIKNVTK